MESGERQWEGYQTERWLNDAVMVDLVDRVGGRGRGTREGLLRLARDPASDLPHAPDPIARRIAAKDVVRVDDLVTTVPLTVDRLTSGRGDGWEVLQVGMNSEYPSTTFFKLGHSLFPVDVVLSLSGRVHVLEDIKGTSLFVICFT